MHLLFVLFVLLTTACTTVPVPAPTKFAWGHADWDTKLRLEISKKLDKFLVAADWETYCPKFNALDQAGKVDAIATLAVAIAKFECDYNPRASAIDVGSTYSTGLFQLSVEDEMQWCDMSSNEALKDPLNNIACAIPEMARLISANGVVASGDKQAFLAGKAKGLARYWSTMWPAYNGEHKEDIIALAKKAPGCL